MDFYRLKNTNAEPFSLYVSADANVELLISGVGEIAMASAVGWIGAQSCERKRVWLNIGTAGHATLALGTILRVHGVARSQQSRAHYPPLTAKWNGGTAALLSVASPTSDYPQGAMVDMEAAAFFSVATRFTSSELVQSIKVISDNQERGVGELNAARITALMAEHTERVARFAQDLCGLVTKVATPQEIHSFDHLHEVKSTYSQRQQLDKLLKKVASLGLDEAVMALDLQASVMRFEELYRAIDKVVVAAVPQLSEQGVGDPRG